MKKLVLKLLIFLSPFILNALLIIIVDPYNFYNISHIIPDDNKKACLGRTMKSTPRGNICWKILEYERNPRNSILIGDSRMVHIKDSISKNVLGDEVYNFSIPGANFITLKDIFWKAVKNKDLHHVYIQVSFLNFSKNVNYDLMESLNKFKISPLKYIYDKDIIIDTWVNLYYSITKNDKIVDINYRERNVDSWERAKAMSLRRLEKYQYSTKFEKELWKMAKYCEDENIKLYFVLIPTHTDFIQKIESQGFKDDYSAFKKLVHTLAPVIDLKSLEESDSDNLKYRDYFHFQQETLDSLTRMIWEEIRLKEYENI